MSKRNERNGPVTPEEFVRAWQAGRTVQAVADACGMTKQAASSRAMHYRRRGIRLKAMQLRRPPLDVKTLTALAKSLAKD